MVSRLKDFVYKKNYLWKIVLLFLFSLVTCLIGKIGGVYLIYINISDTVEYHFNIITINSILSGFSLTNLGILISISSDQLIEKLKGTDILIKRNILISYSIIFGAVSILISLFFVLDFEFFIRGEFIDMVSDILFITEINALILSIFYFLFSLQKMIQLLSYIYIPRNKYTDERIARLKEQMRDSIANGNDEE